VMASAAAHGLVRFALVIPALLLVIFLGLLWLLGLACGSARRKYVTTLSAQALKVIGALLGSSPEGQITGPTSRRR
jgi:hypothetical protein